MFTFLDINTSISNIAIIYPVQTLLIVGLLALGLYELFHLLGFRKNFTHK